MVRWSPYRRFTVRFSVSFPVDLRFLFCFHVRLFVFIVVVVLVLYRHVILIIAGRNPQAEVRAVRSSQVLIPVVDALTNLVQTTSCVELFVAPFEFVGRFARNLVR